MKFQEKIIALLKEKTFHVFDRNHDEVKILINPSFQEMKSLPDTSNAGPEHVEYRGFLLKNDDILIWDGYIAMHSEVSNELGNKDEVILKLIIGKIFVSLVDKDGYKLSDKDLKSWEEKLKSNPNFKRLFKDQKFVSSGKS